MTWCIHNACKIRDKAQRPSAFKSQPSGRLTCSTPELGAQLNLTNDQKRKRHHTCKHVLLHAHVSMSDMWSVSWAALKKGVMLSQLPAMQSKVNGEKSWSPVLRPVVQHIDIDKWEKEKGEDQYSGQQFNTTTSTGETRKKGRLFTLLKRITNSKV